MSKKSFTDDRQKQKNTDQDTAAKRLLRSARVGSGVGGLAVKIAGEKLFGLTIDRADHAKALKQALGNLRGPVVKVAQLLATIPEALPREYTQELMQLQSAAPPMGWPFVRRRMAAELGDDWQDLFTEFGREAAAAASLGQVHKATALDGQIVACKLQYPDMDSAVRADLAQLRLLLGLFERYDNSVKTGDILEEISDRLWEELDYRLEAQRCGMYQTMLDGVEGVHVPRLVPSLCGERLITTTWLDGAPILGFEQADEEAKRQIAINLFRAWYVPLYHYGVIHGDPHFGNYSVRPDHSINLLDFGCVRQFPSQFVQGIIELYRALQSNNDKRAAEAFELWGFRGLSRDVLAALLVWARFLYQPVLDDKTRVIGMAKGKVYGRETAHEVHQALRAAGGVHVPREFVFVDRAALGLGSVFIRLQAKVNWYQLFNELIADFDPKELEKRQKSLAAPAPKKKTSAR